MPSDTVRSRLRFRPYGVASLILFFVGSTLAVGSLAAAPQDRSPGFPAPGGPGGDGQLGKYSYDDFEPTETCTACHVDIARQHEQALMAQSYTHHWDEIEYFELAVPHAEKDPKVAGVKAGCNGCHAPLAFLAGDVPPPRPAEGSRANEGVSCDLCHVITGFTGDTPYNFNYELEPGDTKLGAREPGDSPFHVAEQSGFYRTAEYCGTCHNEQSPYGVWVKSTHLEWQEGPHGRAGIVCQDCHMPPARGKSADLGPEHPDVRQHLFHGAHDDGKLAGDRIFRMPHFDPQGRMTIAQWHTASLGVDYRLWPLQAVNETYTWTVPEMPPGEITVTATVWYSRLVSSVAEHMGVPREESQPVKVASHATTIVIGE